jgi:hypothetical protein
MKFYLTTLLLVLLVKTSIVGASGPSLHENIAHPKVTFSAQNASAHLDDIHHLECQLNISLQHGALNSLRGKAQSISQTFGRDLYLLNKNTLKTCTQVHMDMTNSDTRSYHAHFSDWAPILFNPPAERFVYAGAVFLNGLEPLKDKAMELANLNKHNISRCVIMLERFCQGKAEPCVGNDAFMSRERSPLELKACDQIEPLQHLNKAAKAWLEVASDIEEIGQIFRSTWVAGVVARWIAMLEDLVVRTRKQRSDGKAPAGTTTISHPFRFHCFTHLCARVFGGSKRLNGFHT